MPKYKKINKDVYIRDILNKDKRSVNAFHRLNIYNRDSMKDIQNLVKSMDTKNLAKLKLREAPHTKYDEATNTLGIGNSDVYTTALELSKADTSSNRSDIAKKILGASRAISKAESFLAMPIAIAIASSNHDVESKSKALKGLSLLSASIAAPALLDEVYNISKTIGSSADPVRAAASLAPQSSVSILRDIISSPLTFYSTDRILNSAVKK
jgi:hypothetical protein